MIILKSRKDLENNLSEIWKTAINSVEFDIKTIEENYDSISDEYGPMVILVEEGEKDLLLNRFPLIKELESEGEDVVSLDDSGIIVRNLYLLNDEGYVVYERRAI